MIPTPSPANNIIPIHKLVLRVGELLGVSKARCFSQEHIDAYCSLVEDMHWMHTDPKRCSVDSPFGAAVVPWHRLSAAIPKLSNEAFKVTGVQSEVFYGINKARNPAPLLINEEFVASVKLLALEEKRPGAYHAKLGIAFTKNGSDKPVFVAEYMKIWIAGSEASS